MGRALAGMLLALAMVCGPNCGGGGGGGGGGGSPPPPPAPPPPPTPPSAPTGVTATPGVGSVTVSWTADAAATSYNVYWAQAAGVTPLNYGTLPGGTLTSVGAPAATFTGLSPFSTYYFVVTALNAIGESSASTEVSALPMIASPPPVTAPPVQGTLHPKSGTLQDLTFDNVRNRVYVTNYSSNALEIFDVATSSFLAPLAIGANPYGLDMTPDGSKLLVCLWGSSEIAIVDLVPDPPVVSFTLPVPTDSFGTNQPRFIGCASSNLAFFACMGSWTKLRQLNLATWSITVRSDLNGGDTPGLTFVSTSADRSRLLFADGVSSAGSWYYYTSSTDTFTGTGAITGTLTGAALNGDGSVMALTRFGSTTIVDTDLRSRAVMPGTLVGYVLAPTGDRGYRGISGSPALGIVDTLTYQEIDQITTPVGATGALKINGSGTTVYAIASGGLLAVPVDVNRPPVLEPVGGSLIVNGGESMSLRVRAVDPDGDPIAYAASGLPAGATFNHATRTLTFAPDVSQIGSSYAATLYASDASNATSQTVNFSVTSAGATPMRKIPIAGTIGAIAYEPVLDRLYLANQTRNRVEVVQVGTAARLDPIPVGSAPWGVDVNAAATKLVVCPSQVEYIQVVDLTSTPPGVSTTLAVPVSTLSGERLTPWEVAVASNDHALFANWRPGGGFTHMRDLDLSTNSIAARLDVPPPSSLATQVVLRTTGDRSKVVAGPSTSSEGRMFLYSAATDAFNSPITNSLFVNALDASADGTRYLCALLVETRVYNGTLGTLGVISGSSAQVAVRQGTITTGYRHNNGTTLSVLDLSGFTVSGTITLPEAAAGRMRCNTVGSRLFVVTATGITIITLP